MARAPLERHVGPAVAAALQQFHRRLQAVFGPRLARIALFGSRARGEAGPDSDVDVLVVVKGLSATERKQVIETAADTYVSTGIRLAALALAADEMVRLTALERPIVEELRRDAIDLE